MRIALEDIPKAPFNTRSGNHECTTVLYGLANAPAAFISIMSDAFKHFMHSFIISYFNDILVYSDSWAEIAQYVKLFLHRIRKNKIYSQLSK